MQKKIILFYLLPLFIHFSFLAMETEHLLASIEAGSKTMAAQINSLQKDFKTGCITEDEYKIKAQELQNMANPILQNAVKKLTANIEQEENSLQVTIQVLERIEIKSKGFAPKEKPKKRYCCCILQ